ncbi:hypothetical protein [Actinomadura hibisca]|uniref:hypothetical protein n=1 Tax=Actinomadura hibisca TaxID=68565 RepID=UPI00082A00A0|nr:hypothetical protein [Actinomadura hibisca]
MSDAAIFAVSLGITLLGLFISWGVYRRRGAASGLRGAAWSLVPVAATMTGATGFFMDLAFSPVKWAGVTVAGLAVLLYLVSGGMLARRAGAPEGGGRRAAEAPKAGKASKDGKGGGAGGRRAVERRQAAPVDPELAEIEEILRNRGIK